MASVRLNIFENHSVMHRLGNLRANSINGSLLIHGLYIPGSISFNIAAILVTQGHTSQSASLSFGLYSLSGSTLSLANSASAELNSNANGLKWFTLATSATQDITPGNWYLGFLATTSGNSSISFIANAGLGAASSGHGGILVRGVLSVTTGELPGSVATSDFLKEAGFAGTEQRQYPYILISA